jgi:flagellar FliJ protein
MALSMSGHPVLEPIQAIYGRPDVWRHPTPTVRKAAAPVRSQATSIRRKEFQAEDRRRRVALLKRTIADFERTVADLDREILIEQQRANIHDPAHFAYPTYAKAAILRRDNLKRSADELRAQLSKAKEALLEVGEAGGVISISGRKSRNGM